MAYKPKVLAVSEGGTGDTTLTNHGVLIGQATSDIASTAAGSAGQVLQSGGASADPVYSTATYPSTAGTSGNVLTSNGTNWTSSPASGGTVTSVSGTTDRITSTGGTTPVIDIAATYVGQTSITTLGTVGTGTWNATTIDVAHGGTGRTSLTNHGVLVGASTSAITQLAAGSSGQVLQSGGASADPAYSTATYPATAGTTGNVLTSNGTNWVSSTAPGGGVSSVSVTLTSAQVKALHATPIEIIPAPGSGKGIMIISYSNKLNYGGTNVFVAGAAQTISLYYNNTTTVLVNGMIPNAMIVSSANKFSIGYEPNSSTNQVAGVLDNVNVTAYNSSATEISGNAANDNTITISIVYAIVTF